MIAVVFASREPSRASVLIEAMSRSGYSVTVAHRSKEVHTLISAGRCGLLLVGQELADHSGLELLTALKSRPMTRSLPVIAIVEPTQGFGTPAQGFGTPAQGSGTPAQGSGTPAHWAALTAAGGRRAPSMARLPLRLAFLERGADDCFSLDQDVPECLARIRAVLRRTTAQPAEEIIKVGEVELNLTSYSLHVAGRPVPVTSKELDLLYVFLASPNRVLSRPYLIERVWGYDYFGSPRTVDVHVRRLRQKLGRAARFIQTVPCVGYKMIPDGAFLPRARRT